MRRAIGEGFARRFPSRQAFASNREKEKEDEKLGNVFILNVSIILISGFVAGYLCKRFKISPLIGYLLIGALIGPGALDLTGSKALNEELKSEEQYRRLEVEHTEKAIKTLKEQENMQPFEKELLSEQKELEEPRANVEAQIRALETDEELEKLQKKLADARNSESGISVITEFGCLLLLFAIGIEFTFDKLAATAKYMFGGGILQMGLTIAAGVGVCMLFKMTWVAGLAIGSVLALSSTALVYRSMIDLGQADTKRAQATLALLIFQDIALVPLLLILPRVLGGETTEEVAQWLSNPWIDMCLKSAAFCAIVLFLKVANMRVIIPNLAKLQANDIVILYAIVVLVGMCLVAELFGLTPALGALAAGLALGENRLTHQIDALVMPFREAFSAMFFISLGMLTDFAYVFAHPFICFAALLGAIVFKAIFATGALKACGMDFRGALAFGVSLSQVGELAFMILALAHEKNALPDMAYNTMLFVSVGSLVVTPYMIKIALTKFGMKPEEAATTNNADVISPELRRAMNEAKGHVIIVGAGHIGKRVADEIRILGGSVCLVDFNPVNLHPFSQEGVPTITGDGADQEILREAGIYESDAIFVTIPRDDLAINIVKAARAMNPTLPIIARARYSLNVSTLKRSGATRVFCEEVQIADELVDILQRSSEQMKQLKAVANA